ncbi:S1 RNA-binding domain-containing protein [Spiroplasma endosymbiont of Amphibalanus improvisus]|uniref:S1 RNA-binding domain-containing protein n=1 Tax=Spiroplasma endosymbiont of Amphibalanus improvisus TaxID=3066327 RepID=UPI00313D18B2
MLKPGDIVTAEITNIAPYGAFCKIGDATGLIHISEFSDFFVKSINDFVEVGDSVEVEILSFDEDKKQAKLSYKKIRSELLKTDEN